LPEIRQYALVTSPTFDTPAHVVLNVVGMAVLVVALVVTYRQRKTHGVSWGAFFGIVINISTYGVYVPLGPVVFLIARATWARNPASAHT
jgi:hypothetical protein